MDMKSREFNLDKDNNFSEWYNTIIYAAELADIRYNVKGFVVNRPWAMMSFKKIYALFEKQLEDDGHLPILFPTVIPEENFKKEKEHVEGIAPEVLWVTKAGSENLERPLALRPTSETAFYQMYKIWIASYKDLPYKLYQSCSVFRNEKETNPFLRGVEFLWIETHNCYATADGALAQTRKDGEIMRAVVSDAMGIEFMQFERPKWDTFPGAESTFAYDCLLPDGKILQFGSTHYLAQNFTKAFGVEYLTADGKHEFPHSTCFGPGIWRMMAALAGVHGDNKGLIFPFAVAPVQVAVIPIFRKDDEKNAVLEYCAKIVAELKEAGMSAAIDGSDKSPGFKYNYWELKGVPVRIEAGPREAKEGNITLARRTCKDKTLAAAAGVVKAVREQGALVTKELRERSSARLTESAKDAANIDEVKAILDGKGIARAHFCSLGMEGKPCADALKDATKGGKVRGKRIDGSPVAGETASADSGKCVVCGKPSNQLTYIARQY